MKTLSRLPLRCLLFFFVATLWGQSPSEDLQWLQSQGSAYCSARYDSKTENSWWSETFEFREDHIVCVNKFKPVHSEQVHEFRDKIYYKDLRYEADIADLNVYIFGPGEQYYGYAKVLLYHQGEEWSLYYPVSDPDGRRNLNKVLRALMRLVKSNS